MLVECFNFYESRLNLVQDSLVDTQMKTVEETSFMDLPDLPIAKIINYLDFRTRLKLRVLSARLNRIESGVAANLNKIKFESTTSPEDREFIVELCEVEEELDTKRDSEPDSPASPEDQEFIAVQPPREDEVESDSDWEKESNSPASPEEFIAMQPPREDEVESDLRRRRIWDWDSESNSSSISGDREFKWQPREDGVESDYDYEFGSRSNQSYWGRRKEPPTIRSKDMAAVEKGLPRIALNARVVDLVEVAVHGNESCSRDFNIIKALLNLKAPFLFIDYPRTADDRYNKIRCNPPDLNLSTVLSFANKFARVTLAVSSLSVQDLCVIRKRIAENDCKLAHFIVDVSTIKMMNEFAKECFGVSINHTKIGHKRFRKMFRSENESVELYIDLNRRGQISNMEHYDGNMKTTLNDTVIVFTRGHWGRWSRYGRFGSQERVEMNKVYEYSTIFSDEEDDVEEEMEGEDD